MWNDTFKLALAGVGFLALAIVGMYVFGDIWARVGIGAAAVVVVGGLLLFAWSVDRKEKEKRAGVEDLPRV